MPKSVDTIIVVNADGTISIQPNAIDILAGDTNNPPSSRRIRWHETTIGGPVIAEVYGYHTQADDAGLIMDAHSPLGLSEAQLSLTADDSLSSATKLFALVNSPFGGSIRTIIDDVGESNFLQLPIQKKSTAGAAVATFNGIDMWAYANIPHGFANGNVSAVSQFDSFGYECTLATVNFLPNSCQVRVTSQTFLPPAGTQTTVGYICFEN